MVKIATKEVFEVGYPNSDGIGSHFGYFTKQEDAEFAANLSKGAWGEKGWMKKHVYSIDVFESLAEAGIDKQAEIDKIKSKLTPEEQKLLGIK